jgi:hypothetical protein
MSERSRWLRFHGPGIAKSSATTSACVPRVLNVRLRRCRGADHVPRVVVMHVCLSASIVVLSRVSAAGISVEQRSRQCWQCMRPCCACQSTKSSQ